MRELTNEEASQVSGGFGFIGAVLGFAIGAGGQLLTGGSARSAVMAGALGALSGAAGNMAAAATTGGFIMRTAWGVRSVGTGMASGSVPGDMSSGEFTPYQIYPELS